LTNLELLNASVAPTDAAFILAVTT
jgi:hypothetical protein